jgi:hypothetical protein
MTRKQAAKVADEIMRLANKSSGSVNWRTVDVTVPDKIIEAVRENVHIIEGCLPLGVRIARQRGQETLTLERR